MHPEPAAQGSSEVEHEPEPDGSQAATDLMDIDLVPIPEENLEGVEPDLEPKIEPDESEVPEGEPEYILPFEQYMDPNFVPKFHFWDVLVEKG